MLELKNIVKVYGESDNKVEALRGVSIDFREHELVSILGPSGCGKTTMLNIVGGLDKYSSGDLIINGKSTKDFDDRDWDTYRNQRVGFVFQNYNLIPHLTVLGNVELALTLAGIPTAERRARAIKALEVVGLSDQLKKKPNQLSGGQMQRVAIARAIINNPDIILADEPTGALDSTTSVQVMNILKDLSKERLVVMVTHNNELANKYSTRIIELLDGEMVSDSMPYNHSEDGESSEIVEKTDLIKQAVVEEISQNSDTNSEIVVNEHNDIVKNGVKQKKVKKSAMSFLTAFNLSLKNLFTKKTRTLLTSFAGSIGIIGVALVLAVSNGFTQYINKMQSDTLSGYPITISTITADMEKVMSSMDGGSDKEGNEKYPDEEVIHVTNPVLDYADMARYTFISPEFVEYLEKYREEDAKKNEDNKTMNDIVFSYGSSMTIVGKQKNAYKRVSNSPAQTSVMGTVNTGSFCEGLNSEEFVRSQYDVIYGKYPTAYNELALVVSSRNELSKNLLDNLAIEYKTNPDGTINDINFSDLVANGSNPGKEYKLVYPNDYYIPKTVDGKLTYVTNKDNEGMYNSSNSLTLKIVGVFRVKEGAPLSVYSSGIVYTPELTKHYRDIAKQSDIVVNQRSIVFDTPNEEFYIPYILNISGQNIECKTPTILKSLAKERLNVDLTDEQIYQYSIQQFGASSIPSSIHIYPKDFHSKDKICEYLNAWNKDPNHANNQIYYTDATALLSSTLGELVDIISYVLIAFASISLVVSSIMIGIITYVSVVERTKEIGVLRALGARKKDIRRVFNAETMIIGFSAGLIGVLVSLLLTLPINMIIGGLAKGMVGNIAILSLAHCIVLVAISTTLTLISGLVPAQIASKKDPVVALRTE